MSGALSSARATLYKNITEDHTADAIDFYVHFDEVVPQKSKRPVTVTRIKDFAKMLLCSLLLVSCSWHEEYEPNDRLTYDYEPIQAHSITVEVVPTQGAQYDFQDVYMELNAEYFNRYGIYVEMYEADTLHLEEKYTDGNIIFYPLNREGHEHIKSYVVAPENMKVKGAAGYAIPGHLATVVRDDRMDYSTLAHEIGHLFLGPEHSDDPNNVMYYTSARAPQQKPKNFTPEQIAKIKSQL